MDHILVSGSGSEVVVVGGNVVDVRNGWGSDPVFSELQIDDDSNRSMFLNAMTRLRLPRLTSTERGNLSQVKAGDMIYNKTDNKAQIYNGTSWKDLWT